MLHAYAWNAVPPAERPFLRRLAGRRCAWLTERHEPALPAEFARVREQVRAAGMAFVAYVSPEHSRAPDVVAEMRRMVAAHDLDGLYLDGVAHDVLEHDRVVRAARELLGPSRILYVNVADQPLGTPSVPLWFVDSWADFVLRGASGRGGADRDSFLRYGVSGRNLSNAVGMWCWYRSSGRLVQRETPPPPEDVAAAARAGVRLWRRSQAWQRFPQALADFDRAVELEFDISDMV